MNMITIMTTFIYISTILAMISTAVVCINYLLKKKTYAIDYNSISKHIKTCRNASFTFTFFVWFLNSFEKKSDCLKGYQALSKVCSRMGYYWLIYAFVCIAICIIMASLKKESSLIDGISKFRNSGFIMGAIFLVISFLLNV